MSKRLNMERRELIEEHLSSGWSFRRIAAALCVVASSVSREVSRNGGAAGYRAAVAQERAARMRVGVGPPRVCVLAWAAAREKLGLRWSPEQVAGAAPPGLAISASTIRRRIKADWGRQHAHLRRRGKPYLSRAERRAQSCNCIPNRVHFSQRPPQADARAQRGHWEMDTLLDPGAHQRAGALILADRATRQIVLFPLPRVSARACADAASALLRRRIVRSITADNGGEFAQHARITQATGAPVFFTDPHAPQQRATCENAVALVRDMTRGKRLGSMSPTQLRAIAERINQRPMKTHQWRSRNQTAKRL